ncbi:General vesicular transport factor p115 [Acanthosepion pharaonis]|uniref:General vesicular transport factor p115 n=1 Tax=Acanthosepion pharaonis TaxID=158019 RepID=A0A812CR41_ACAPH|nr:General vesicular transport factor p115 [Sepia pharaonis]
MNYFRKVLGAPQGGTLPSSADTIERLCDRVQSSTLLEDRRDAVRALKSLSKKYALEVGTQAMDILIKVLETDRGDAEIIGYAVDTLCNIMSNEPSDDDSLSLIEDEVPNHIPDDLGGQFTEIFIKNSENVTLLLSLLEEYDFHVRWPTVKLLTILLTNKSKEIQEIILISPMGVSKLMDLLSDSREIIRNEALLLLIQLTKGNANIQKIVAFENAFERLLDIIRDEGNSDGGIVVEDCLLLMLNLMKTNTSNQNFFKEGSYIQKLTPYFDLESSSQSAGWSAQKVTNIHLMFQLVRTLVSPNNPLNQTAACQKVMNSCNLLKRLCTILMASGVPADVLTETINTVSEIIRGNLSNQEFFASVMAPSNPPRPAIVVLLMSMVNEKQPFVLRCAVLYCFQSFLFKNEVGQSQIVQTLLPTTADVNTITAGQLLCGGLFSGDSLSNWFASVALLHAILENNTQREQLLRVQLATSLGNPPVSLLQQCCNMLAQGGKLQTRIGLLMLLCGWLSDCSIAVTHFLCNTANVPYLIAQISTSEGDEQEQLVQGLCAFLLGISVLFNDDQNETFNKASLCQIIADRIGMETFIDKLSQVVKHESYTKAAKKPHLNYKHPNEVIFDYEFTRLFKSLENEVLHAVSVSDDKGKSKSASVQEHSNIVIQYKELIREQDTQLNEMKKELKKLQAKDTSCKEEMDEMKLQIQQLKDQNAVLKAQKGSYGSQTDSKKEEELSQMKQELENLQSKLKAKDDELQKVKVDLIAAQAACVNLNELSGGEENKENCPTETAHLQTSIQQLTVEMTELRHTLADKDEQIHTALSQKEELEKLLESKKAESNTEAVPSSVSEEQLATLTEQVKTVQSEKTALQARLTKSNDENLRLLDKIKKLEEEKNNINIEKENILVDTETLKKEQEDLLVLLADQDCRIDQYKKKLKELGELDIDDDDDDDDDDEVEDYDEEDKDES